MKPISLLLVILFSLALPLSSSSASPYTDALSQLNERSEVYFKVFLRNRTDIEEIRSLLPVDRVENLQAYASANDSEFTAFLRLGLDYEVITPPGLLFEENLTAPSRKSLAETGEFDWFHYPSYQGYLDMIARMVALYPTFVDTQTLIDTLYNTKRPHKQIMVHVTSDVGTENCKPKFLMCAAIHGNETSNIMHMLRLIDWLPSNYATDARAKRILDSIDLYILPCENPDGTWRSNDDVITKSKPTRRNLNGVDLNRNFPRMPGRSKDNKRDSTYLDPEPQKETASLMNWITSRPFRFSMEIEWHTGFTTISTPWSLVRRHHVDFPWYLYISRKFSDTAKKLRGNNYFTKCDGAGQGFGCLYQSIGNQKDWVTYFQLMRGNCIETSPKHPVPESHLEDDLNMLLDPTLTYTLQVLNGIRGKVTDSLTGNPLQAKVWVDEHDALIDSSHVYSDSAHCGVYYRPIDSGTYAVTFSAPGYVSKTVSGIRVEREAAAIVDVELRSVESLFATGRVIVGNGNLTIVPVSGGIAINGLKKNAVISIYSPSGRLVRSLHSAAGGRIVWDGSDSRGMSARTGCFIVHVASTAGVSVRPFTLLK